MQETKKGFIHKYLLEFNQIFIIHSLTHYQYDFNYLFLKKYNSADWLKNAWIAKLNRIPLDHSVPRQSFWRERSRRRRYKAYILALKCKHGTDLYRFAALLMTKRHETEWGRRRRGQAYTLALKCRHGPQTSTGLPRN